MKIYVDEIPKDCEECELNCGICCGATMNDISEENKKYCPLKSLAEHDKQVRKEVCEDIRKEFLYISGTSTILANNGCIGSRTLEKFLDQIQGEQNGSKN